MKYEEYKNKEKEYRASGQTAVKWCEQEKISVQTLRTWQKRVKKREANEKGMLNEPQGKSYAEYRELVIAAKTSGITAKEWCKQRGIPYTTYGTWRKKVHRAEGQNVIDSLCDIRRGRKPEPKISAQPVLCELRR